MSHLETTLMTQMELDQLLQFRNLEMAEKSLLLPFPKLIRIDEDCRVTSLLLRLFPSVKFRNDPSTWHFRKKVKVWQVEDISLKGESGIALKWLLRNGVIVYKWTGYLFEMNSELTRDITSSRN